MSRPLSQIIQLSAPMAGSTGPAAPRQLSLTEELERLEQSITLTMQEIDRNFSQCHRIITHSIMPIVDRYAEHSRELCEGISFWKGFFEDSADVAIGTYESRPEEEATMTTEETFEETHDDGEAEQTVDPTETIVMQGGGGTGDGEAEREDHTMTLQDEDTDSTDHEFEDESILASMNLTGSKPKRPDSRNDKQATKWAAMQSPYDKLKKEVRSQQQAPRRRMSLDDSMDESMTPPRLPASMEALNLQDSKSSLLDPPTTPDMLRGNPSSSRRMLDSPEDDDSPFAPSTARATTAGLPTTSSRRPNKREPIMHRAVDTNWRIQATPQRKTPRKVSATTVTPKHRVITPYADSSPMSSPPPPQITTVFSPINTAKRLGFNIKPREKPDPQPAAQQPRDPKTPVTARKRWDTLDPKTMTAKDLLMDDDFDDDDDDDFNKLGFSPPVTMQFTLPPSRLMQTPAKQASKMLVNDIMRSAGFRAGFAGGDDTQSTMDPSLQDSPSMMPGSPDFDFINQ
ncbi:DASH complex subunit ask1 [Orbilia brochopaga]|uniref:DASH complex subunit ASK1 n=1 Tax=Orbilia brochopaga TaxID=3140254 RepID=A0AAV9USS9_9PEZI